MKQEDKLVIKSNSLIDMQTDLKLTQLKIFTKVIIQIVKEPNSEFCRFSIQELMQEFNMTDSNYTALKSATAGMIKAVILKTQNGEVQLPLFTQVSYEKGIVDMYLHPKLKPYILDIKQRYTKYFFKSITGLNSMYSMRLYELLKQYEFRKSRTFTMDELRFLLNI
jgi:plasmid replication initiation protein